MSRYLDGISQENVHRLWLLKKAVKEQGRRGATITGLLNTLLDEDLADLEAAVVRFSAPQKGGDVARTQAPAPE